MYLHITCSTFNACLKNPMWYAGNANLTHPKCPAQYIILEENTYALLLKQYSIPYGTRSDGPYGCNCERLTTRALNRTCLSMAQ